VEESFHTSATSESRSARLVLTDKAVIKRLSTALTFLVRNQSIDRPTAETVLRDLESIKPLCNFDADKKYLDTMAMFPDVK
jgi:hypothetical protein